MAGEMFIRQRCSQFSSSLTGLSDEEPRLSEHLHFLLASAQSIGDKQFELASKLISKCDYFSSKKGNPVQRLLYYFSEALKEKIGLETGRILSKGSVKMQAFDNQEQLTKASRDNIAFHQKVPFSQVCQFTGIQAIIENITKASKVHIIDLEIRNGIQFTVWMQALVARCEYPIEHLRITASGTKSKSNIEETGKRLMSFADSLNLTFYFNVFMVVDIVDLNEDLFELAAEETVAIYSAYFLSSMIVWLDRLQCDGSDQEH